MNRAKRKKFLLLTAGLIVFAGVAAAGVIMYLNRGISVKGDMLTIKDGKNKLQIQLCTDNILKVHNLPEGEETPHSAVIGTTEWKDVGVKINKWSNPIVIKTDKMTVKVDKNTHRVSVYDAKGGLLVKEQNVDNVYEGGVKLSHNQGDNFYGISGYDAWEDSSSGLLRNDGNDIDAGKQGHAGGPLAWSTKGYGILVDSSEGTYDIKDTEINFTHSSKKDTEYYVLVGKPTDILSAVSSISGKAPMFPKWATGFTNTEWGIDENELKSIVSTYRAKNIPIDNYTLDFDWKAWGQDNYGEFKWNTTNFPDGPSGKLKSDMDAQGIKLTGIMKPRIGVDTVQGKFATENDFWWPGKAPYSDYFSHKTVNDVNFAKPEVRKWYFDSVKGSFDTGIIGWWNDEADEGYDNLQFMNMERAMYDGQRSVSNQRVWSINRNFFLGSQRYAYGLWSGDIRTGFPSMAMQRERMLSAIDLGEAKWGMDTGGFSGTPNPENYARWIEFSAFTPIFRVHGGQNEQRQPWVYGPVAEAASKDIMQLRYKLIPYVYSYDRRAYENGIGLVKPLIFDYPEDKNVENDVDAWMFGDYMLVSPVVKEGETVKNIYLPEGQWIDYFKGTRYTGGKTITYNIDANTWKDVPLFIKEGAIIPSQDYMNYVGEKPVANIYLDLFPGKEQTSFRYYDDDGVTYNYEKGQYFIQNMTLQDKDDAAVFNISNKEGSFTPDLKYYILKMHGKTGSSVQVNGADIKQAKDYDSLLSSNEEGWVSSKDMYGSVTYVKVQAGDAKNVEVKGTSDAVTK